MTKAAAVLAALALCAGCTGASSSAPVPAADPAARPGGVLRVGITAPGGVDPGNTYEPMGELVVRTMCDSLLTTDPVTAELRPGLAQSWAVTDKGRRLVLRLRKGLRFSDGTAMTADDVVFTLSRIASVDFASASARELEAIEGYPEISGEVPADDEEAHRRLAGVSAVDPRTVEIALRRPQANFFQRLTSALTAPVARKATSANPAAAARSPVCVGPYRLAEPWRPGATRLRLTRSPSYDGGATGLTRGGRGWAEEIELQVFPTGEKAAAAAARGDIDVAAARPTDTGGVRTGPGDAVEFLALPAGVFPDAGVRRALSLALDRAALARTVHKGAREPATGFLPPATGPAFRRSACGTLPPTADVDGARKELRASGQDLRGARVVLYVNDLGTNRAVATAVAAQWQRAFGLQVVVQAQPFESLLTRAQSARGLDGAFRWSWRAPHADADAALHPLFATDRIGSDNVSRFSDPMVDEVLRRAQRTTDPADRRIELQRAETLLCTAMPMIPLTFSIRRYLFGPRILAARDAWVDAASGQPLLRELYLP